MQLVGLVPSFSKEHLPDFIVWTGDNARHDADRVIPRTAQDIYSANEVVAQMLKTVGVPTAPSIGNNDVYPHNVLCLRPNDENLGNLSQIWKDFIPPSQMPIFLGLGSYVKDVTPKIQIVSLNTMSMYNRNPCSLGCHRGQDGHMVLSWLESVLAAAQQQGKRVIISGHIPPVAEFWFDQCVNQYSELSTNYQTVIMGHLYGHTHQDNFGIIPESKNASNAVGVINIAPSVVSTYNPSIRQFTYIPESGTILDYTQFFSNLTTDNASGNLQWLREYTWSSAYGYPTWSLSSWVDLSTRIQTNPMIKSLYITYRYVSSGMTQFRTCTPHAEAAGLCAIHRDQFHNHE